MSEAGTAMRRFAGHTFYRALAAVCVVLVVVFAWQLYESWDWGELFFLAVAAWSAVRCALLMSSSVELTADRLRIVAPLQAVREIEFRQIAEVYGAGRGLKSVLLLYYPRDAAGIVATDGASSLALPAVNEHEALLAALEAEVRP